MQKGKQEKALKELEKAEEFAQQAKANDIFLSVQTMKGNLLRTLGKFEKALEVYTLSLKSIEKILSKYPGDEFYLSIFRENLDAIGALGDLFCKMGNYPQEQSCYELKLSIYLKSLEKDPENIEYQFICIRLRDKMHESVIFYAKISTFKSENHYTWYSKLCIKFVNR